MSKDKVQGDPPRVRIDIVPTPCADSKVPVQVGPKPILCTVSHRVQHANPFVEAHTYQDLDIRVNLLHSIQVDLDLKRRVRLGGDDVGVVVVEEGGECDAFVPAWGFDLDRAFRSAL